MKYKLKPILENTVIHTPTEEDAKEPLEILHENGWKWIYGEKSLIDKTSWNVYEDATGYFLEDGCVEYGDLNDSDNTEDGTILTFAEFKDKYCQEEPKMEVGDKVKIKETYYKEELHGRIGIVRSEASPFSFYVEIDNTIYQVGLNDLEPYTEPTEEKQNNNDMETKELNLVELLRGHEGENFYSLASGELTLNEITSANDTYPLRLSCSNYTSDGKFEPRGICVLYPSRDLYEQYPLDPVKAWSVWEEEQKKYKTYIQIYTVGSDYLPEVAIEDKYYFRTPTDRDKAIEEIKSVIKKYSK